VRLLTGDPSFGAEFSRCTVRLADGVFFHVIGPRPVLFSEARQSMFALRGTSAFLAARCVEFCSIGELTRDLEARGLTAQQSATHLHAFLRDASRAGHIAFQIAHGVHDNAVRFSVDLAGHCFSVTGDSSVDASILPYFQHLTCTQLGIRIAILRDGADWLLCPDKGAGLLVRQPEVVPALKGLITTGCLMAEKNGLFVHGATVERDGAALLLLGPPGTGKTVMALHLLQRQFRLTGDDIALLGDEARLTALPFLPAVKKDAWALASRVCPGLAPAAKHQRLDGVTVKYATVEMLAAKEPLTVGTIAILNRVQRGKAQLKKANAETVIAALVAEAHGQGRRLTQHQLQALIAMVSAARCVAITYADAGDAAQRLEQRHAR
jgi:hypothetical protein